MMHIFRYYVMFALVRPALRVLPFDIDTELCDFV